MGGAKKRSLSQIEKQQRLRAEKRDQKTQKKTSRTLKDEGLGELKFSKIGEEALKSELSNMRAITPYAVASKYSLRLSKAKDFLEEMEAKRIIRLVIGNSRIKVYKFVGN